MRFEKSGDGGIISSVLSVNCCGIVLSSVLVTSCISVLCSVSVFFDVSSSSICFPKSISHETAYHSLCDTLTSGSGRYSFDRTVTSGMR